MSLCNLGADLEHAEVNIISLMPEIKEKKNSKLTSVLIVNVLHKVHRWKECDLYSSLTCTESSGNFPGDFKAGRTNLQFLLKKILL